MNAPTYKGASIDKIIGIVSIAFPPIAVIMAAYVLSGDAMFGLAQVVGKRMPTRLVRVLRRIYLWSNAVFFGVFYCLMVLPCILLKEGGICSATPLKERWCLLASTSLLLWFIVAVWMDRAAVLMLHFPDQQTFLRGVKARVAIAVSVCVVVMAISNADFSAILLLLVLVGRRVLDCLKTPKWFLDGYVNVFKLTCILLLVFILKHGRSRASEACPTIQPKLILSATLAICLY